MPILDFYTCLVFGSMALCFLISKGLYHLYMYLYNLVEIKIEPEPLKLNSTML